MPIQKELPLISSVLLKSFAYSDSMTFLKVYCIVLLQSQMSSLNILNKNKKWRPFISMSYLFYWCSDGPFVIFRNKEFPCIFFPKVFHSGQVEKTTPKVSLDETANCSFSFQSQVFLFIIKA